MRSIAPRGTAVAALLTLLMLAPSPARASSPGYADGYAIGGSSSVAVTAAAAPCTDRAYNLLGGSWKKTYVWSFRNSSTPAGLVRSAARDAIKAGFSNIVNARNNCGRTDNVSATESYAGTTDRRPGLSRRGFCTSSDGFNAVGFGSLPSGVLAVTCTYSVNDRIVEADIRINSNVRWATSLAGCSGQPLLEPVMTHEAGHVFGLGHVGEAKHGRLTMSRYLDGSCQNNESTLGLGDLRGLEQLY